MRQWPVDPQYLCRKHLLGAHVESHMAARSLVLGKSIRGHVRKGQLLPQRIGEYHERCVAAMLQRGYRHNSPLDSVPTYAGDAPEMDQRILADQLLERCSECAGLTRAHGWHPWPLAGWR